MGKALYRKYRSKSLSEIVGQEHITDTLSKALKSGRISHAYLFSGPRGVGKTSIARILAHEINGLPYTDDSAHLDIIEIDAASNRRIDEIRDLRDKVYIAPTSGKYKVYIIDEVHMLTREAFNALLKTLEEPPAHAVFILATTEAHKLPETIISRTQHYTFKPVETQKVIDHLKYIAKQEKITITEDALQLLAAHGGGSFRDSISLLDQASSLEGSITLDHVRSFLGIAPDSAIQQLISAISNPSTPNVILQQLQELYGQGFHAANISSQLASALRVSLTENSLQLSLPTTLKLLKDLIEVPASSNSNRLLEIILLDCATQAPIQAEKPLISPKPQVDIKKTVPSKKPEITKEPKNENIPKSHNASEEPIADAATLVNHHKRPLAASTPLNETVWPQVLDSIKKQYNTLYGVLRMAHPIFLDGEIELQLKFPFHQKRLNEVKNRKIIADFIKEVTGKDIVVRCTVNKDASPISVAQTPVQQAPVTASTNSLNSINDIFGGGEVLNS